MRYFGGKTTKREKTINKKPKDKDLPVICHRRHRGETGILLHSFLNSTVVWVGVYRHDGDALPQGNDPSRLIIVMGAWLFPEADQEGNGYKIYCPQAFISQFLRIYCNKIPIYI
jgi:hypothetical protein